MTTSDPSAQSDDLFTSLLQSLAQPDPGERAASTDRPTGMTSGTDRAAADAVDRELFPSLLIDLSDDAPPIPTDISEMTAAAEIDRWGPDAVSPPPPVDPVVIAELFPDDDDTARPTPLTVGTFEPHVPWWDNRRIQAAIGVGAVLLLIAGGLFLALRDTSSGSTEDLTTDTLPEATVRNEDAAITTTTAAAGPTPSGLPVAPEETAGKTGTTVKSSTPTTKKPGTTVAPGKPPSGGTSSGGSPTPTTTPETTPTTEAPPTTAPPVDADVQWGREMAARTSVYLWPGTWQIGDAAPADSNALFAATFDEPARLLTVTIDVTSDDRYDLRFIVSVVPGTEYTTNGTNYGSVTASIDGNRSLTLSGTQIPGTSVSSALINGPLTTTNVRLSVSGDSDGFEPVNFGLYEFG